jgi:hypothetical protein
MEADAWSLEQALWTGGVETYERTLAPRALTVVPAERGLLDRAATMDASRSAPRWSRVEMLERRDMRPRADIIVLAYRAEATREDGDAYRAWCSSVYMRERDGWRLALHQQTPLPKP